MPAPSGGGGYVPAGFDTSVGEAERRALFDVRRQVRELKEAVEGGGGPPGDDGEHVLTGDPGDPPDDLGVGQLLWDGVEGGSGGGGDAGPHDHDYLPLTGGTLTGNLAAPTTYDTGAPTYLFAGVTGTGMWGAPDGKMGFATGEQERLRITDTDVTSAVIIQTPTTANTGAPTYTFTGATGAGMWCYDSNLMGFAVSGSEFFRNEGGVNKFTGDLLVNGIGVSRFNVAPDIDTANVLDRAETATMPSLDDEGVATADAESVTVNEVVTALLAKVKELSARIEELEGT